MVPYFTEHFGNPSSRSHGFGWRAAEAVEEARARVASLIGAAPSEIVFTSGGTEANNLAIKGLAEHSRARGDHVVTCTTEHKSVLDCCASLGRRGLSITHVPVDGFGRVDLDRLRESLTDDTILLSVMAANNEIGTIHPLGEIGAVARERGVPWHCDAVQAAGKTDVDVRALGADLMSISAHKMYGPKGVGALYVRRGGRPRVRVAPQVHGGGQERDLRSGTLNVPGIVGLGKACELCQGELEDEGARLAALRDRLHRGITRQLENVGLNGHPQDRLPGHLSLTFGGVDGAALLLALKEIALSAGSACSSGSGEPSHVLRAIGMDADRAFSSLRFGLGRFSTAEEIDYTAQRVVEAVGRLRQRASAEPRAAAAGNRGEAPNATPPV